VVSSSLLIAATGASATARAQAQPEPPAPPVAAAQPVGMNSVVERPGFDLGVRLGYAIPMGDILQDASIGDLMSGAIPVIIEGAYRATPNFSIGALFQGAFAQTKNCDPGASCSATIYRFGVEGIYTARGDGTFDPWFGLGVGYEQMNLSVSSGGTSNDLDVHGFDATLQAGGEHRVGPQVAIGPFVSLSIGQYGTLSSGGQSADIPGDATRMHEWLQFGARGTFNF
jgi:hypothetical protein